MNLNQLKRKADKLLEQYRHFDKVVLNETRNVKRLKRHVRNCEKAQKIVQTTAQQVQDQAHSRIASVVSRCLETVFDEPYEFRIEFERKRGRTEAVLSFIRDGHEYDPTTMTGGGVVDVAAFALRLACLNLTRPRRRQLLISDEPFKGLHSPVYRKRLRSLIQQLSKEMKFQFIIVTGIPDYEIGKIIRL